MHTIFLSFGSALCGFFGGLNFNPNPNILETKETTTIMLLITNFLIGFAVILGSLFIVGITRGNKVSQKTWVILWSIISFSFVLFLIISAILENEIILNYALGGSVGYVTAVSIHTIDHAVKEFKKARTI